MPPYYCPSTLDLKNSEDGSTVRKLTWLKTYLTRVVSRTVSAIPRLC